MQPTYTILGADGQKYGPVTLDQIKGWIQEGRIGADTSVWRSDQTAWAPASNFSELGAVPQAVAVATAVPPAIPSTSTRIQTAETEALEKRIKNGAGWFYWIAALSLINTISALSGSEFGFIIGLGLTDIVNAIARELGSGGTIVAIVLDAILLGMFGLFGFFAGKRHQWAFLVGMIIYGLDGLIFVVASQWLSVAFHAFAVFSIFQGFKANSEYKALQRR